MKIDPEKWEFPNYPVFFEMGPAAEYGAEAYHEINQKIKGRVAMDEVDAAILAQAVRNAGGVYLEFGSLFGGSAILAAMVMKKFNIPGFVLCVDDGEMADDKNIILDNAVVMGVDEKIFIQHEKIKNARINQRPSVTLVDAGHDYGNCLHDITIAEKVTRNLIVVHDYDPDHAGVVQAVAMSTWLPVFIYGHMIVLAEGAK